MARGVEYLESSLACKNLRKAESCLCCRIKEWERCGSLVNSQLRKGILRKACPGNGYLTSNPIQQ